MTAQAGARSTAMLFLHDHRPSKRESWPLQLHHDVREGQVDHVDVVPRAAKRQGGPDTSKWAVRPGLQSRGWPWDGPKVLAPHSLNDMPFHVMTAQAGARSTAMLFLHDHRPSKRESWPLQLHHDVREGQVDHVDVVPRAAKRQGGPDTSKWAVPLLGKAGLQIRRTCGTNHVCLGSAQSGSP